MDRELNDLGIDITIKRKMLTTDGKSFVKKMLENELIDAEVKMIKRILYLTQGGIIANKEQVKRMVLQEKFARLDLRETHQKESYSTLYLSVNGHLMYHTYGTNFLPVEFDFGNEELVKSINRKVLISTLLEFYLPN